MVPIDHNGFWSLFTPKNCHVADVTRMRGESVYSFNNPQKYIVSYVVALTFFLTIYLEHPLHTKDA